MPANVVKNKTQEKKIVITSNFKIVEIGTRKKRTKLYEGVCDCGNVVYRTLKKLKESYSCGCVRPGAQKERKTLLERGRAASKALFNNRKNQAKYRNLQWSIDFESFLQYTSSNCHYCGTQPSCSTHFGNSGLKRYNGAYIYNGLDRIDSSLGYIEGNIVPCCASCNRMKMDLKYDTFIALVLKISSIHGVVKNDKQCN